MFLKVLPAQLGETFLGMPKNTFVEKSMHCADSAGECQKKLHKSASGFAAWEALCSVAKALELFLRNN